jgi:cell wall-associated NlpC family hydrolase
MTQTDLYTHIHSDTRVPKRASRSKWTSFGLAAAVAVAAAIFGIPTTALAKPMPQSQERVIAKSAQDAVAVFDSLTELGEADRNEVFSAHVANIAAQAAIFLGVDARRMQQAWLAADLAHQRALITGLTQLGVPYKINTAIENVAFDCSGLVEFAWRKAGVGLSRGSSAQFASAKIVKVDEAQPGDLIWRPGHISMYLGVPSAVLQTPYSGRSVELQMMNERITSWVKYANPLI